MRTELKSRYWTCGKEFATKKDAVRFARNIASAMRLTGKPVRECRVMVYELDAPMGDEGIVVPA